MAAVLILLLCQESPGPGAGRTVSAFTPCFMWPISLSLVNYKVRIPVYVHTHIHTYVHTCMHTYVWACCRTRVKGIILLILVSSRYYNYMGTEESQSWVHRQHGCLGCQLRRKRFFFFLTKNKILLHAIFWPGLPLPHLLPTFPPIPLEKGLLS